MIITVTQMIIHYAQNQMNKTSQIENKQILESNNKMPLKSLEMEVWCQGGFRGLALANCAFVLPLRLQNSLQGETHMS